MSANNDIIFTSDMKLHICIQQPERESEWRCYLWGSTDTYYIPLKGAVPNRFIRWMMKICLGCRWEKTK